MRIVIVPVIIERSASGEYTAAAGRALSPEVERQVRAVAGPEVERALRADAPAPPVAAPPASVCSALSDELAGFVRESCELMPGKWVCVSDFYRAYMRWAVRNRKRMPLSREAVAELLYERGVQYSRGRRVEGKQCRTWEGIGLLDRGARGGGAFDVEETKSSLRKALEALEKL